MLWLKRLAVGVVLVAIMAYGVLFSMENDARVAVDLLFLQLPELPFAIWIIMAFAAGGIGGLLASSVSLVKARSQHMMLSRKLSKAKQELSSIRTSALKN